MGRETRRHQTDIMASGGVGRRAEPASCPNVGFSNAVGPRRPAPAEIPLLLGRAAGPSHRGHDGYPSIALDRASMTVFSGVTFLSAGPASERSRSAAGGTR